MIRALGLLLLLAPGAALAVAADTVEVTVVLEGAPLAGAEVKVVGEPPGGGEIGFGTAVSGADGTALFEVPFRPGLVLTASAVHEGVRYSSPQGMYSGDGTAGLSLRLEVFPRGAAATTADLAWGPRSHVIVELDEGVLRVTEVLFLENRGRGTFAPEGGLVIPLPEKFQGVQGLGGKPMFAREHVGAAAPGPFLPGESQIDLMFRLPYQGATVDFEQPLSLPLSRIRVIVDEAPGLSVAGPAVLSQEVRDSQGRQLRLADLDTSGGRIAFRLEGLPHHSGVGRWVAAGLALGIIALGLVLGFAGRGADERTGEHAAASDEREALLDELEQLERDRASGDIDEDAYAEDRDLLAERLADVLRTLER